MYSLFIQETDVSLRDVCVIVDKHSGIPASYQKKYSETFFFVYPIDVIILSTTGESIDDIDARTKVTDTF